MVLIGIDNLKTKSIDSLEDLTVYESDVTSLPVPKFELTFSVEFISRQLNLLATNYAVEFGNPWVRLYLLSLLSTFYSLAFTFSFSIIHS